MSDISKHLGDERRLRLSINKIKEVISKSTPVVNWYAHTEDKTVRGPFGRWFTASGEDKHLANINNDVEYCAMAMTILPEMVEEIQQLKQQLEVENKNNYEMSAEMEHLRNQLKEAVEVIEFYGNTVNYEYAGDKFFGGYARPAINRELEDVCHVNNDEWILYGGKRARQFLAKYRGV